jgi:AraC family transcriptional activator of mtrCDE
MIGMTNPPLDRLLTTLDVAVDALAVCEVRQGVSLLGQPEDAVVVHYVLSGTMHLAVPGAPPIVCGRGSIVVVPPGLAQSIAADDAPVETVVASDRLSLGRDGLLLVDAADGRPGDLRFVCGMVSANIPSLIGLLDTAGATLVADLSDLALVDHAFDLMLDEIADFGLGSRALIGALMKSCLVMMVRRRLESRSPSIAPRDHLNRPQLGKALNAVLDRPSSPHTVATMATEAGMSRSRFAKAFVEAFEMTPMAFVAKARLHHAVEMLRSTKAPVKAVAAAVGFSSRSHFSRVFRQAYGSDPTEFRRSLTASIQV